jgi:hypothetical protein
LKAHIQAPCSHFFLSLKILIAYFFLSFWDLTILYHKYAVLSTALCNEKAEAGASAFID